MEAKIEVKLICDGNVIFSEDITAANGESEVIQAMLKAGLEKMYVIVQNKIDTEVCE